MNSITPLDPFVRRVLTSEIPTGVPDTLKIVLPLTTEPGKEFAATVVALSDRCLPTCECDWKVTMDCPEAGLAPLRIEFIRGELAALRIEGLSFAAPGVYRLRVRCEGAAIVSTPSVCREAHPFHVYWGDPHVHTILSNCHTKHCRSLPFAYFAGRYLSTLDWMACADHVSSGRCALPQWREEVAANNHHNVPGEFVTLPAYEASLKGGCGGDNNIYMRTWPSIFADHYENGDIKSLMAELEKLLPAGDAFAVPHHTTRAVKHGEIPTAIYPGADKMPVAEITSCWGTSESRGNPDPLWEIHDGPSYLVDLLNQGLRLGFVGGTDTHISLPFQRDNRGNHLHSDPGGTGVYAAELTRDAIYEGIRSRSCYAGKRERSYLNASINGYRPGEWVEDPGAAKGKTIQVEAAGPSTIEAIDFIRNGKVIHSIAGTAWHQIEEFTDNDELTAHALRSEIMGLFVYYYTRIRYKDATLAWSSPVWFKC
ncbi:MAG: hypothetical protein HQL31_08105 [Planctomycetes bacterium]|nr:hypothetical protein [Planctomycetota bacterium]